MKKRQHIKAGGGVDVQRVHEGWQKFKWGTIHSCGLSGIHILIAKIRPTNILLSHMIFSLPRHVDGQK